MSESAHLLLTYNLGTPSLMRATIAAARSLKKL